MNLHRIGKAWVNADGKIMVKITQRSGGGMNIALKEEDVVWVMENLRGIPIRSHPKTPIQLKNFARFIVNKDLAISSFGKTSSIEDYVKECRRSMANKKVEWKLKNVQDDVDIVQDKLEGLRGQIAEAIGGKSSFLGWTQVKCGEAEKPNERTIMAGFAKATGEKSEFSLACSKITKLIKSLGYDVDSFEIKE